MTDVAFRSASELAKMIQSKDISSRELLDVYLERVDQHNPKLNAVVTLDAEGARKRADEADAALARGESLGPLHGVPMTVKDTIEVARMRTTAGFQPFSDHVPSAHATTVERLAQAGAIVFGKTNVPVLASDWQSTNPIFGTTNNPWDMTRTPGGSSGGSAAALAAGLAGLEIGSDIGGSIRIPAHFCGVYGHKPTHGIVPARGHIPGPPGTLGEPDIAALGPLARSADDLDLSLSILAGPREDRALAWRLALPPPRQRALGAYRIAAWIDDPLCPVESEMRVQFEATVAGLRKAGTQVDENARPAINLSDAVRTYMQLLWPIMMAGMPPEQIEAMQTQADQLPSDDDGFFARMVRFGTQQHRDWIVANEMREQMRACWATFFRDYDVLLCPVSPFAATPHDHSEPFHERTVTVGGEPRLYADQFMWAGAIGMALLPATVAPIGRLSNGLPVGVQIVGPYLEDRTTIDVARRLAEVMGGFEPPPGY